MENSAEDEVVTPCNIDKPFRFAGLTLEACANPRENRDIPVFKKCLREICIFYNQKQFVEKGQTNDEVNDEVKVGI